MKSSFTILAALVAAGMAGCGQESAAPATDTQPEATAEDQPMAGQGSAGEAFEVVPGLSARILERGYGRAAEPGDYVEVHYTGWLYDPEAEGMRGAKFDSSIDRGETFHFTLGAGQVIRGWDQGVDGMLLGETRELTIAPEMAYGDRGAGNVIPPGATLVFEVELQGLEGPSD